MTTVFLRFCRSKLGQNIHAGASVICNLQYIFIYREYNAFVLLELYTYTTEMFILYNCHCVASENRTYEPKSWQHTSHLLALAWLGAGFVGLRMEGRMGGVGIKL